MPDSPRQWTLEERDAALAELDRARSRLREVEAELEKANEALEECVRLSGADLSDGFPTWPSLPVFAVQEVTRLRADQDEDDTYDLYRQALKDNADFAMRVEQAETRAERLEAELEKAADTFQELATYLHLGLERARGVLRKGETGRNS